MRRSVESLWRVTVSEFTPAKPAFFKMNFARTFSKFPAALPFLPSVKASCCWDAADGVLGCCGDYCLAGCCAMCAGVGVARRRSVSTRAGSLVVYA